MRSPTESKEDETGNEPRIGKTKPDKEEEEEIGVGRGGKAATFGVQSGGEGEGSRGRSGSEEGGRETAEESAGVGSGGRRGATGFWGRNSSSSL